VLTDEEDKIQPRHLGALKRNKEKKRKGLADPHSFLAAREQLRKIGKNPFSRTKKNGRGSKCNLARLKGKGRRPPQEKGKRTSLCRRNPLPGTGPLTKQNNPSSAGRSLVLNAESGEKRIRQNGGELMFDKWKTCLGDNGQIARHRHQGRKCGNEEGRRRGNHGGLVR